MHAVRFAQGCFANFGKSEPAHLARRDQISHRADGILNRHARIDAMQALPAAQSDHLALSVELDVPEHAFE